MNDNHYILVDEKGYVSSKAINIAGSKHRMVPVTGDVYKSLDDSVLTAYVYNGSEFVLDEKRVPAFSGKAPLSALDEIRLAVAELAELVTGGSIDVKNLL